MKVKDLMSTNISCITEESSVFSHRTADAKGGCGKPSGLQPAGTASRHGHRSRSGAARTGKEH